MILNGISRKYKFIDEDCLNIFYSTQIYAKYSLMIYTVSNLYIRWVSI